MLGAHLLGGVTQAVEVVARHDHLERRRQPNRAGRLNWYCTPGEVLEIRAHARHRGFLVLAPGARRQRDAEAAGVLAGVDGIGVEAVAGAGDAE